MGSIIVFIENKTLTPLALESVIEKLQIEKQLMLAFDVSEEETLVRVMTVDK